MSNSEKFKKIAAPKPAPKPAKKTTAPSSGSSSPKNSFEEAQNYFEKIFGANGANFDEREFKEALEYLNAIVSPGWTFDRYKPSAFGYALEMDKNRGFNNTPVSQGAVEKRNPDQLSEIENFKLQHPSGLKDLLTDKPIDNLNNINLDESSGRYKDMKEKLFGNTSASTNSKFVKTSQKSKIDEIKNITPNWTIQNVLMDMAKEASRKDISDAQKQRNMGIVLSEYEKKMAPLSQYLRNNDIKYK